MVFYENSLSGKYGRLLHREEDVLDMELSAENRLWSTRQIVDPDRFTTEKRKIIEEKLLELRKKHQAIRVSMRIYENDLTAHLLFDLYRPGPGRGPIPKEFWIVNLNSPDYKSLQKDFSNPGFMLREISKLGPNSKLAIAAKKLRVETIVSVPDPGNSYFYISLDFELKQDEKSLEIILSDLKQTSRDISQLLFF